MRETAIATFPLKTDLRFELALLVNSALETRTRFICIRIIVLPCTCTSLPNACRADNSPDYFIKHFVSISSEALKYFFFTGIIILLSIKLLDLNKNCLFVKQKRRVLWDLVLSCPFQPSKFLSVKKEILIPQTSGRKKQISLEQPFFSIFEF